MNHARLELATYRVCFSKILEICEAIVITNYTNGPVVMNGMRVCS